MDAREGPAGPPRGRGEAAERAVVFGVDRPIGRDDIPALCRRVNALLDRGPVDVLICDVGAIGPPDAVTLDALARLQLAARRRGCRVALRNASIDLWGLLAAAGLSDIVPLETPHGRPCAPPAPGG